MFAPTASNPLHAHIEALAVAAPRLVAEAPPDFRLSAVSYRIAALEEQLRQQVREPRTVLTAGRRVMLFWVEAAAKARIEQCSCDVRAVPRSVQPWQDLTVPAFRMLQHLGATFGNTQKAVAFIPANVGWRELENVT